jgi:hypothetical protein
MMSTDLVSEAPCWMLTPETAPREIPPTTAAVTVREYPASAEMPSPEAVIVPAYVPGATVAPTMTVISALNVLPAKLGGATVIKTPVGSPVTRKDTSPENDPPMVAVPMTVSDPPWTTVPELGVRAMAMVGGPESMGVSPEPHDAAARVRKPSVTRTVRRTMGRWAANMGDSSKQE